MQNFRLNPSRIYFGLLGLVVTVLSVVLISRTLSRGDDFLVFYRVAQRFWDGVRPYDQVTFGNMVFKYPPWILPAFLPFGFFDLWAAKLLWGIIEAVSLVAVVTKIHRGVSALPSVRPWIQTLFLVTLFGLFGSHGMTGQITLSILAIALWVDPVRSSFTKFFLLTWSLSAKMTSLFPLLHVISASPRRKKIVFSVVSTAALFIVLSFPVYYKSYSHHYAHLRDEWSGAMFSGTEDVNSVRIGFTTRDVQGLPSFLLRKTGLDERKSSHVLFSVFFSVFLLGGGWFVFSRTLSQSAQWIGWLALLPAVQPLAWFHVFLFTYPALVIGTEAAIRDRRYWSFWGFLVSGLFIGAITIKTLGAFGAELEMASIKLWGSLLTVFLFRLGLVAKIMTPGK